MLLKKQLNDATGTGTYNFAAKSDPIASKAGIDNLDLVNWLMCQLV